MQKGFEPVAVKQADFQLASIRRNVVSLSRSGQKVSAGERRQMRMSIWRHRGQGTNECRRVSDATLGEISAQGFEPAEVSAESRRGKRT